MTKVRQVKVRQVVDIFLATLREIFDEAAYARFLGRNSLDSSRESYAAFMREHDLAKARRPRCC
jgi:hypothetical protein